MTNSSSFKARLGWHRLSDRAFTGLVVAAGLLILVLIADMAVFLFQQASPSLSHYGLISFLTSSRWAPSEATDTGAGPNPYGLLQFVYGTIVTSAIAMLIAVPAAIAIGLFLNEIAPIRFRRLLTGVVDLLAAVPSVVYGFWGIFGFIPALRAPITQLSLDVSNVPILGELFKGPFFGFSYLTASLILAIMVLPIITSICREVFTTVPRELKEAAYALGATRWEMIRMAVLPWSRAGIVGASILGLGRALGETIAVTMVIGNSVLAIHTSLLSQGATMASVIANEFTEATEPFHLESLFVVALVLLAISVIVNAGARVLLRGVERA